MKYSYCRHGKELWLQGTAQRRWREAAFYFTTLYILVTVVRPAVATALQGRTDEQLLGN